MSTVEAFVESPAPKERISIKKVLVSGAGFMSDAYMLFVIDLVKEALKHLYTPVPYTVSHFDGVIAPRIATAALIGAVLGQLVFGGLADALGRRLIFVCTISFVCIGSLGSALSFEINGSADSLFWQLTIWQFIMGFGIGGEYPLSATVTSESSNTNRGASMAAVFSMQGIGNLLACVVFAISLAAGMPTTAVWRFALAFGALPGLCSVYFRYKMHESKAFTKVQAETGSDDEAEEKPFLHGSSSEQSLILNAQPEIEVEDSIAINATSNSAVLPQESNNKQIHHHDRQHRSGLLGGIQRMLYLLWEFRWAMIGTAGNWFIFDIVFYGNSLFATSVLDSSNHSELTRHQLEDLSIQKLYIAAAALPGYIFAVWFIDSMGRRKMQLMGFGMMCIVFAVMAGTFHPVMKVGTGLFIFLYSLSFFFSNFGPNTTTFIVPSESFPTRARATCHGLSAASGKLGAVVGGEILPEILNHSGVPAVMATCAAISVFGFGWTFFFTPETRDVNIEDIDASKVSNTNTHSRLEGDKYEKNTPFLDQI